MPANYAHDATCSGINVGQLTRKRAVFVKEEATAGTAVDNTELNIVLAREITVTPIEATTVERNLIRDYFGNFPELLADRRASVVIECEFVGAGTRDAGGEQTPNAPQWAALLKSCGFKATETVAVSGTKGNIIYTPVSDTSEMCTSTILCRVDGIEHKLRGCLGTFSLSMSNGEIPTITFTMTGHYNAPSDTDGTPVPNDSVVLVPPPRLVNDRNTYYSVAAGSLFADAFTSRLLSLSLDLANEVTYREVIDANATGQGTFATTGQNILITDRRATGSISVEAAIPTEVNPWDLVGTGVGRTLEIGHGAQTGNELVPGVGIKLIAPSVTLGQPTYGDDSGVVTLDVPLRFQPSEGNDDITITVE